MHIGPPFLDLKFYFAGSVLLGQTREELEAFAKALGQPAFRGKQLYDGILHGAASVAAISNVRALS